MAVHCEFYNEDGSINLDLTTKIMRWNKKAVYNNSAGVRLGMSDSLLNPFTKAKQVWYGQDDEDKSAAKLISSTGVSTQNDLWLKSGLVDGVIYLISTIGMLGGGATTDKTAQWVEYNATENWGVGGYDSSDYIQIFSQTGELMWSMKTLSNAIIFDTEIRPTALGQVHKFTSPRGKRVYIDCNTVFSCVGMNDVSTYVSCVAAKWSNNGTTVEFAYVSYYDDTIVNAFKYAGSLRVGLYEVLGEV